MDEDMQEIIKKMKENYFEWIDSRIEVYEENISFYTNAGNREMMQWNKGRLSAIKEAKLMFHSKFS